MYQPYMDQLPANEEILPLMEKQVKDLRDLLQDLPDERAAEGYAAGKWSVKELLQHLVDSERIFGYRALCFSRGEETPLPGYDENKYVTTSQANSRTLKDILDEYELVRRSNLAMFQSFKEKMLDKTGIASGRRLSLRGLIYLIAAHERHHLNILKDRYLQHHQ